MTESPEKSPHTLLLGGGYSLSLLASTLGKGSFVITSRRSEVVAAFRDKGYASAKADISEPHSIQSLLDAYPFLHTVVDSVPPLGAVQGEMSEIYEPYLAALSNSSIARAFFLSSTGVYGQSDGEWVDEESITEPSSESGKKRLWCEELYRASSLATTSFRISGIYGPGRGLRRRLESGSYSLVEGHDNWTNRIHVEDIAGVLSKALEQENKLPEMINLSDDEPALMSEVVRYYCEKFDYPLPETISKEQAEREGRFRFLSSKRVSNALLHQTLNYEFKYPNFRAVCE